MYHLVQPAKILHCAQTVCWFFFTDLRTNRYFCLIEH